jgi:hypothetical protein
MTSSALDPLSRIAIACGTDKWGAHLYTPDYHKMFSHRRDEPLRILEIGVGGYKNKKLGGRSLRMWAEYFPNAQVTGLDIHEKQLDLGPRVSIAQGSQDDAELLRRLSEERGPFDIVIDDGSHLVKHMLVTFEALFPLVAPDGIYAIEDVQTVYWPSYGGGPTGANSIMSRVGQLIRAMHADEVTAMGGTPIDTKWGDQVSGVHFFRNVILIQRGPNDYPSNARFDASRPTVKRVMTALDQEIAEAPSEGAVLIKAQMLQMSGQRAQALGVATAGVGRYPESIDLVLLALRLASYLGRESERRLLQDRLEQLVSEPVSEPGDEAGDEA